MSEENRDEEIREFVTKEVSWLVSFLMTKYGLRVPEAKKIIGDILTLEI